MGSTKQSHTSHPSSAQHKPDQQFSPLQPPTAGAPSPLSYFNFTSLIGWQLRAPNECSYFVSKLIPICTQELSLSPFSAYICTLKIPWIHSFLDSCNRQEQGRKISLKREGISLKKAGSLHDGNTKTILDGQLLPLESLCTFYKKVQDFSIKYKVGKNFYLYNNDYNHQQSALGNVKKLS